jgi:ketosteroid isomerase-like protein
MTQTEKHPHVVLIEAYYAAYARNDWNALRNEFFDPDIVWRIPGHHSLSGNHRGVDQVIAFFEQLGKAGFQAEPITLAASDDWVIDLHRGWNTEGPARIDIVWALAFRIQHGRIVEAINFPSDQHAADAFYLAEYPLKPLPDRLADQ